LNGKALHFYLAGINNQNFLMRDKETGTWWQQITGKAIYGPLKGASLDLVPYDELSFGEWKSEVTGGQVFAPVAKYTKEYDSNWEPEVAKLPVVISFPGTELKSRDVIVGVELDGSSRAYPWDTLVRQSPIMDHLAGKPILLAIGPDGKSFRAFLSQIDGQDAEFFLKRDPANDAPAPESKPSTSPNPADSKSPSATTPAATPIAPAKSQSAPSTAGVPLSVAGASGSRPVQPAQQPATSSPDPTAKTAPPPTPKPWILLDSTTASEWNFQGCAVSGPAQGKCLNRVPILKDYWFDWRNYHPDTTVYKH